MKKENKYSVMAWAIVILAVLNVTTLATILYHAYGENDIAPTLLKQDSTENESFSGCYFRDKLSLDSIQMNNFREFNHEFRIQARNTAFELQEKRNRMFILMTGPGSDTAGLNMLSDSIGYLHSRLKKLTYRYYLDMKAICSEEQQQQLEELFREVFTADQQLGPGRRGQGGQHRRGMVQ